MLPALCKTQSPSRDLTGQFTSSTHSINLCELLPLLHTSAAAYRPLTTERPDRSPSCSGARRAAPHQLSPRQGRRHQCKGRKCASPCLPLTPSPPPPSLAFACLHRQPRSTHIRSLALPNPALYGPHKYRLVPATTHPPLAETTTLAATCRFGPAAAQPPPHPIPSAISSNDAPPATRPPTHGRANTCLRHTFRRCVKRHRTRRKKRRCTLRWSSNSMRLSTCSWKREPTSKPTYS